MNSFFKKAKKSITFFSVIINLIIIFLLVFCSLTMLKFSITKNLVISNYNIIFGLFNIGLFIIFMYGYKLFNYFKTVIYLKKIKLNQVNNNLFNDLLKKIRVELNPVTYLVLAISSFLIFIWILTQEKKVRNIELSGLIFIKKLTLSLILFAFFELISIFMILIKKIKYLLKEVIF
ncbi:hypothetical protein [Spiroplasma endosymbiont of Atherix ibis]|uniref:hypothetical protein n=1 Tax=Spiroplasma endosymbiont of Atherix ibis TaxID=3066291 RepID=UPI0030D0BE9E